MTVQITRHTADFATAPQLAPEDVAALASAGFRTLINNRPDGEGGPEQPASAAIADAARAAGLAYHDLPVIPAQFTPEQVAAFAALLQSAEAPVLAFCRSGARSTSLWRLATGQ